MNRSNSERNRAQLAYGWLSIAVLIVLNQHEPHTHHDLHKDMKNNETNKSQRGRGC